MSSVQAVRPAAVAHTSSPALLAAAAAAIALPALLAYNISPSATFLNQAAAIVGWSGFLLMLSRTGDMAQPLRSRGLWALLAALALCAASALGAAWFDGLPWPLSLSPVALIVAAGLTAWVGAAAARSEWGPAAFRAVCIALVAAGVLSMIVGMIQVFAPDWADGVWIAGAAFEGRASGNLRQPNHLSSLLLWSAIAAVWLGEAGHLARRAAMGLALFFVFGLVLTASRTGIVGVLLLALWGLLDRRLSRSMRALLLLTPLAYAICWLGLAAWARESHHVFGGEVRLHAEGDISSSRFAIWSDTLALIAQHPWLGVGFGEFNFAWSLTPFPHRPVAFFDHTHNLELQLAVEMGLPLALLVMALMAYALWRAFASADETAPAHAPMRRAAFMMVLLIAVHSQLEYPLWYAYFLLPCAFVWGLCLGGETPAATAAPAPARWLAIACVVMMLGGLGAVLDYLRVARIFVADVGATPLAQRIAEGERSLLFAHHAHYAAATVAEHPADAMPSFGIATHYLLDTRLMMAWAKALAEAGDVERARHIAERLREFRNEDAKPFFAPCDEPSPPGSELPFQCTPPTKRLDYQDFR